MTKIFCLCFLVIVQAAIETGCVSGPKYQAVETSRLVPENWNPGWIGGILLDEVFPNDDAPQAELTVRSGMQAKIADAQLFWAYVRLWDVLDDEGRSRLYKEQTQWLRDRPGMAERENEYPSGSISGMTFNIAFTRVTLHRIEILDRRYWKAAGRRE